MDAVVLIPQSVSPAREAETISWVPRLGPVGRYPPALLLAVYLVADFVEVQTHSLVRRGYKRIPGCTCQTAATSTSDMQGLNSLITADNSDMQMHTQHCRETPHTCS